MIRTQVEEIDGRDGDIITKLGYSAYDKEITIGLYGDYDVDDIITYFNSEGTVTFSNEPNMYYHYQIIQQIDFERLIRFKTATVTFHIQPFKFSLAETPKTFNITNETSVQIRNIGNTTAKPRITFYGSGTLNISLNNYQVFVINLGDEGYITIDTALMEAYKDTIYTLKNRLVTGNYENFVLNQGVNTISWSGTITKIQIEDFSRWI